MPHILYKFATRSRPEKYKATIQNIQTLSRHSDYHILVSADSDDPTMQDAESSDKVTVMYGVSKSKIDAINRDLPFNDWDILVNISDDMVFTCEGFDLEIIEAFGNNFDQFIHFPDGHTDIRLCSLSIIGRDYYERFGYIYHPDYVSLWCDNEALEVAQELGKWKYIDKLIFEHKHPAWTGAKADDLLIKTQQYYRQDNRTYLRRKACGFPKHSVI